MTSRSVRRSRWAELDPRTLHDLVALRIAVFVVEQGCVYPELDGRDLETGTEHLWVADDAGPASYLRVLHEPDGDLRIGRVCTRPDVRGGGLAADLLVAVLDRFPDRAIVLAAQQHLTRWYERFGFEATGPAFLDDGIGHVPMRRAVTPARPAAHAAAPADR